MTENTTDKVDVKVGVWLPDGTFTGEVLRFAGEEVGSYTDYSPANSRDDRGTTYTLYRCPPGNRYRVAVEEWSRWHTESSEAALFPNGSSAEDRGPEEPLYDYSETYSEEQVRRDYPELFAALGMPNVRDLDDEAEYTSLEATMPEGAGEDTNPHAESTLDKMAGGMTEKTGRASQANASTGPAAGTEGNIQTDVEGDTQGATQGGTYTYILSAK